MGGRFIFVSTAAVCMQIGDLGRFGVLTALATLITNFVGLELYQSINRELANDTAPAGERGRYMAFATCGALTAGTGSLIILASLGWSIASFLLGACIVLSEHFGTELFRMLVIEKKTNAALLSFSIRSGAWAILLPFLTIVHIHRHSWSLNEVLIWWLTFSMIANLAVFRLSSDYLFSFPVVRQLAPWVIEKKAYIATWLTVALCWRALENGGRLISGMTLGYALTGHFTLLNTLSAIPLSLQKGFIEPIMFADLSRPDSQKQRKQLLLWAIALSLLGLVGGFVALGAYKIYGHLPLGPSDAVVFVALSVLSITLMISQPYHFHLYSMGRDREVLMSSLASIIIGLPMAFVGAWAFGAPGLASGLAAGAAVLLYRKRRASLRLKPERMTYNHLA
jgi:O-antigen/teichoic acid export membrane protein